MAVLVVGVFGGGAIVVLDASVDGLGIQWGGVGGNGGRDGFGRHYYFRRVHGLGNECLVSEAFGWFWELEILTK